MRGKYQFREPVLLDDAGLYITAAQMQFFLNKREGKQQFRSGDPAFLSYYKNCCLYNLVYDMMEKNEVCAKMYWDENNQTIALSFPMRGSVATALAQVASSFLYKKDEDDEQDNPFGIFN